MYMAVGLRNCRDVAAVQYPAHESEIVPERGWRSQVRGAIQLQACGALSPDSHFLSMPI